MDCFIQQIDRSMTVRFSTLQPLVRLPKFRHTMGVLIVVKRSHYKQICSIAFGNVSGIFQITITHSEIHQAISVGCWERTGARAMEYKPSQVGIAARL